MHARRSLLAFGIVLAGATDASATDSSLHFALGDVIGSEQFCGLSYDQSAIETFIQKHVSPDDMNFAGDLDSHIGARKSENEDMSPSAKTAFCAQIARTARFYGFTK